MREETSCYWSSTIKFMMPWGRWQLNLKIPFVLKDHGEWPEIASYYFQPSTVIWDARGVGRMKTPIFWLDWPKTYFSFWAMLWKKKKKLNMIQFYFWMRDFANSRDGKLIIPDLRRFGIMMPWWKWWLSWKIPIARGMGRWQNHFLNGLTYFSCPWFCDSANHTVVCLFFLSFCELIFSEV